MAVEAANSFDFRYSLCSISEKKPASGLGLVKFISVSTMPVNHSVTAVKKNGRISGASLFMSRAKPKSYALHRRKTGFGLLQENACEHYSLISIKSSTASLTSLTAWRWALPVNPVGDA